jgi:hypothetical protein
MRLLSRAGNATPSGKRESSTEYSMSSSPRQKAKTTEAPRAPLK